MAERLTRVRFEHVRVWVALAVSTPLAIAITVALTLAYERQGELEQRTDFAPHVGRQPVALATAGEDRVRVVHPNRASRGASKEENVMRRVLFAVTCSLVLAVISVKVASPASAQQGVLSGTWTSTDHDGSNQQLDIRGSGKGSYAMRLYDDSATGACGGSPARFVGRGVVDGNELLMRGTLVCLPGGSHLGRINIGFVYSPETDTLTDETGVTWYRS